VSAPHLLIADSLPELRCSQSQKCDHLPLEEIKRLKYLTIEIEIALLCAHSRPDSKMFGRKLCMSLIAIANWQLPIGAIFYFDASTTTLWALRAAAASIVTSSIALSRFYE